MVFLKRRSTQISSQGRSAEEGENKTDKQKKTIENKTEKVEGEEEEEEDEQTKTEDKQRQIKQHNS